MNLADVVIVFLVLVFIFWVPFSSFKKRKNKEAPIGCKCSGCAYKDFCGKNAPKQ